MAFVLSVDDEFLYLLKPLRFAIFSMLFVDNDSLLERDEHQQYISKENTNKDPKSSQQFQMLGAHHVFKSMVFYSEVFFRNIICIYYFPLLLFWALCGHVILWYFFLRVSFYF